MYSHLVYSHLTIKEHKTLVVRCMISRDIKIMKSCLDFLFKYSGKHSMYLFTYLVFNVFTPHIFYIQQGLYVCLLLNLKNIIINASFLADLLDNSLFIRAVTAKLS